MDADAPTTVGLADVERPPWWLALLRRAGTPDPLRPCTAVDRLVFAGIVFAGSCLFAVLLYQPDEGLVRRGANALQVLEVVGLGIGTLIVAGFALWGAPPRARVVVDGLLKFAIVIWIVGFKVPVLFAVITMVAGLDMLSALTQRPQSPRGRTAIGALRTTCLLVGLPLLVIYVLRG